MRHLSTATVLLSALAACDGSTTVPRDAAPPPASAAAPTPAAANTCPSGDALGSLLQPYGRTLPRACATAHAGDAGSFELRFTFGADGAPKDISAGCTEPSTKRCIEDQVQTWRFPSACAGQKISILLPSAFN